VHSTKQTPIPAEVETGGAGPAAVDDLAVDKKTEEKAESGQLAEEAEDEARLDVEKVVEKSSSQRPGLASQTPHLLPPLEQKKGAIDGRHATAGAQEAGQFQGHSLIQVDAITAADTQLEAPGRCKIQ
jgi:hypothetical protein